MSRAVTTSVTKNGCKGGYDLEHIADVARQRFIDGFDTVQLLQQARTQAEREEAVLISMLKISDDQVRELELNCLHADNCDLLDCRQKIKALLEKQLVDSTS